MLTRLGLTLLSISLLLTSCTPGSRSQESAEGSHDMGVKANYQARLGSEFEPIGTQIGAFNLPRRVRHTPTGIVLILVDPGTFMMGTPLSEKHRDRDEEQHIVTIDTSFYLGETEVTVSQWKQIMGPGPERLPDNGELPIGGVTWYRAQEFVKRLNQSGESGWRLPKEAEWEYACRAGTTTAFSFGEDITPEQVNYNGKRPYLSKKRGLDRNAPVPVRSLPPNPWGFYEMHGNLWEWCEDLYLKHPARDTLPQDTTGLSRVMRGGGFPSRGKQARSGYRDGYPPRSPGPKYGFRIAKTIGE
ncbi:MAG: formylglycine-generating enzyme family protein [Nitrospirota bacterium]|nr:formylglycine-generating enzyme family protein [Nitrospirota bacterium]